MADNNFTHVELMPITEHPLTALGAISALVILLPQVGLAIQTASSI